MKCDIFVSYSREDKNEVFPFVKQISDAVKTECWIDLEGIESGEQFENVIINAINECKIVLFMLSDSSLKSEWTKREVYYAEGEGKRIVPILVEGKNLRGWFKFHFGNVDFIDIHSVEQKEKLIKNIKHWLAMDEVYQKKTSPQLSASKAQDVKNIPIGYDPGIKPFFKSFVSQSQKTVLLHKCFLIIFGVIVVIVLSFLFFKGCGTGLPFKDYRRDSLLVLPDSCFHLVRFDSLLGYTNESNEMVIPAQWKYAGAFSEGLARVVDENGQYGFIDKTGELVIPYQWKYADSFKNGLSLVVDAYGNWGCINSKGIEVIPCQWKYMSDFDEEGFARVMNEENLYGFIDRTGKMLLTNLRIN